MVQSKKNSGERRNGTKSNYFTLLLTFTLVSCNSTSNLILPKGLFNYIICCFFFFLCGLLFSSKKRIVQFLYPHECICIHDDKYIYVYIYIFMHVCMYTRTFFFPFFLVVENDFRKNPSGYLSFEFLEKSSDKNE